MIPELLDYDHHLTPDSMVIDGGAYNGAWSEAVFKRYACHIRAYEPIRQFFEAAAQRLAPFPHVALHNYALGVWRQELMFAIADNSTGLYATGERVEVSAVSAVEVIAELGGRIALLKLNIEGMEYPVLESILNAGMIDQIDALQVQWHFNAPAAQLRWQTLRERLAATHFCAKTTDTNWQIWARHV